jgi:hypothetical protein
MTKVLMCICGANTVTSLATHNFWEAAAWFVATMSCWTVFELEDKYER